MTHVPGPPAVEVRRAGARARSTGPGRESAHSFSFGAAYDPGNTAFGPLLACNDEVLAPGAGFAPHPHREVEIVTWVLEGALVHEDSDGHRTVVRTGGVQRLRAGTGVVHSERWAPSRDPGARTRFVQAWLAPTGPGGDPAYDRAGATAALHGGDLVVVASGRTEHTAAVRLDQPAALHVARLRPGDRVVVPPADLAHVLVATGTVELEGAGGLGAGDEARLTRPAGPAVTALTAAEVLVWQLPDPARP